jgi:hypothetical protein
VSGRGSGMGEKISHDNTDNPDIETKYMSDEVFSKVVSVLLSTEHHAMKVH